MWSKIRRSHLAVAGVAVVVLGVTSGLLQAGAAAQTSAARCPTAHLQVWRGDPGSGTAGGVYYELEFTNVTSSACTLSGYPGVSAVSAGGQQLGSPAARDPRFAPTTVTLLPGATAHAVLRITDVANFPTATCEPTRAGGLKIYPPNTTRATVLPFRFRACSKSGPSYLLVRTVRSHVGVPGYSQ